MNSRWILALLLAVVLVGCARPPEGSSLSTDRPGRGGAKAPEPKKAEAAAEAAAEGAAAEAEADVKPAPVAPPAPEPLPSDPSSAVAVPPAQQAAALVQKLEGSLQTAVFVGGVASLDRIEKEVGGLLLPPLNLTFNRFLHTDLPAKVQKATGLKTLDWLDRSRPIRAAVRNSLEEAVVVIPIKDRALLMEALPPQDAKVEGKAEASPYVRLGDTWGEIGEKDLFLSDKPEHLSHLDGMTKLELMRMEVPSLAFVSVSGQSLHGMIGAMLEEIERSMDDAGTMDSASKEMVARFMSLAKDLISEVDRASLETSLDQGKAVFRGQLDARADTKLGQAIAAMPNEAIDSLAFMPAKSWYVQGQKIPPAVFLPWLDRYMDIVSSALKMSAQDKYEITNNYRDLVSLLTGDTSAAFYTDAGFPMSMSVVAITNDGPKTKELVERVYNYYFVKTLEGLPPETRQALTGRTLADLVGQLNPMVKPYGMDLSISSEVYADVTIDFLRITMDYQLLKLPPDSQWVKVLIEDKLEGALCYTQDKLIFTFGPNGVVRAKEIIDGTRQFDAVAVFGKGVNEARYNQLGRFDYLRLVDDLRIIPPAAVLLDAPEDKAVLDILRGDPGLFFYGGTKNTSAWFEVRMDIVRVLGLAARAAAQRAAEEGETKLEVQPPADQPEAPAPEAAPAAAPAPEAPAPAAPAAPEAAPAAPAQP
jgi:hypothetical protein